MLIFKLFLVPAFIALITISGRFWGASVAGLLSGLPVIAGPISWFIYIENGLDFAQKAAVATLGGIVALSSFCFSYSWLCSRLNWMTTLFISTAIYFAIAILMGKLNLGLNELALLAAVVVILQIYFSPKLRNRPLLAAASMNEILCRMLFALLLVFGITRFAETLGETYSGIFAAFPVAGSTIAIFSHRNYSAEHAIRSLKSMKQGLLSMLAFFYVVAAVSGAFGFLFAVIVATVTALLLQAVVVYLRQSYNNSLNSAH